MAIATSSGGSAAPFAKFFNVGDTLIGALASDPLHCKRQQQDFDSKKPKFKDDGKPMLEEVIWLVALPGTTALVGNDTSLTPIEPLDLVRFSVSGYKWNQVIEARKTLPAANGFQAGKDASGDIYTFRLVGWSAETKNAAAATANGFTVTEGRIVLRTQEEKDRYVLAQSRAGGNTNPAKDFEVTVRRPTAADKAYEQRADEVFLTKPWVRVAAGAPAADDAQYEEPF